jgi:hypothetical protein
VHKESITENTQIIISNVTFSHLVWSKKSCWFFYSKIAFKDFAMKKSCEDIKSDVESVNQEVDQTSNLTGDYSNVAILLFLYLLQGENDKLKFSRNHIWS